ncbi:MAG TPA: hypothetical protein VGR91_19790 [Stellaceae bacterium]|nr:hypothetical protein [Stellaceae bacterium]
MPSGTHCNAIRWVKVPEDLGDDTRWRAVARRIWRALEDMLIVDAGRLAAWEARP